MQNQGITVSNDEGYGNDNVTRNEQYWLKMKNNHAALAASISMHFSAVLHKQQHRKQVSSFQVLFIYSKQFKLLLCCLANSEKLIAASQTVRGII